jgi:hypothetical protein
MAFQRNLGLKGRDVDGIYGAGTRRAFNIKYPKRKRVSQGQIDRLRGDVEGVDIDGAPDPGETNLAQLRSVSVQGSGRE